MDENKYARSVSLICSTCGSTDFEYDKERDEGPIRCASCDRVFSRGELVRENGANIDAHVEEIGNEVAKDLERELNASFRKAFSGSKHIRFR